MGSDLVIFLAHSFPAPYSYYTSRYAYFHILSLLIPSVHGELLGWRATGNSSPSHVCGWQGERSRVGGDLFIMTFLYLFINLFFVHRLRLQREGGGPSSESAHRLYKPHNRRVSSNGGGRTEPTRPI